MAKLRKETHSTTSAILDFFNRGSPGGPRGSNGDPGSGAPRPTAVIPKEQQQLIQGEQRLRELGSARADKEVKIAEAKRDQNKIGQLELTYEDQRAKLFQGAFKAGLNMVDLMKRLVALQITLTHEVEKETSARIQSSQAGILKQQQTEAQSATSFFEDVGSGKFFDDLADKKSKELDQKVGRDIVGALQRSKDKGVSIGPQGQEILKEADRLAARQGTSVTDLANTDFSNLLELSKYDFSGLQPLNGLTLSIQ